MADKGFDLSSRAMLVSLSISHWQARKLDRKATNDVNDRNNAARDAGRYNKQLVAKTALGEVNRIVNEARAEFFSRTLPWQDGGSRLLPARSYDKFSNKMRELRWDFEREVSLFVNSYGKHVEQARVTLGGLFNELDYPTAEDIEGKFAFNTSIMPMPVADDFRVKLSDDVVADVRQAITSEIETRIKSAHNDVVTRITDVLGTMADKLRNYDREQGVGIFRDSLVGNVTRLAELVPELNVTDDKLVEALGRKMADLANVDADDLREDAKLRASTADEAARLAELAKTYLA